jgi:hypothetical protein
MFETLNQQVSLLEATCHRALNKKDDPSVR